MPAHDKQQIAIFFVHPQLHKIQIPSTSKKYSNLFRKTSNTAIQHKTHTIKHFQMYSGKNRTKKTKKVEKRNSNSSESTQNASSSDELNHNLTLMPHISHNTQNQHNTQSYTPHNHNHHHNLTNGTNINIPNGINHNTMMDYKTEHNATMTINTSGTSTDSNQSGNIKRTSNTSHPGDTHR